MAKFDLDVERAALYDAICSMDHYTYVSADQVGGLIGLVKQGLKDKSRENRVAVMNYLIGEAVDAMLDVKFESFKNMSSAIATLLITLLRKEDSIPWRLNDYGYKLIAGAESRVKALVEA